MAKTIIPRRDELITSGDQVTQRYIKFFEGVGSQINIIEDEIVTQLDISSEVGQLRATTAYLQDRVDILEDEIIGLKAAVNNLLNQAGQRLKGVGPWLPTGYYEKNDLATQNGWAGYALEDTTEQLAPVSTTPSEYLLPDVPAWATLNNTSIIQSGAVYSITEAIKVTRMRVWPPAVGASITYKIVLVDITDPANPILEQILGLSFTANVWNEVPLGGGIQVPGKEILVYLQAENQSSNTLITGGWTFNGASNVNPPAAQGWNYSSSNTLVRIDKTDLDSNDRTSELMSVTPGSTLEFLQTNDFAINRTFSVTGSPVDQGTYVEYATVLNDSNGVIGTNETTTVNITVPVPDPTEYVQLNGFWPGGDPDWGTVTGYLAFDGVEQAVPTAAFGVDLRAERIAVSDKWQLVSFSDI